MNIYPLIQNFAGACNLKGGDFLSFPHWYDYLQGTTDATNACIPKISAIGDIWLIVAAVVEIMLRIGALAAVGLVIYGGIQFITAQGEPDKATKARQTIINALIGLVISIAAATIVTFVAGSFK
jgi:hypothetical protein